jgi:hypothetical protein
MTASYRITFDDPKLFTRSWTQDFGMELHPTWKLLEYECEENNRCEAGTCNSGTPKRNSAPPPKEVRKWYF